MRGLTPVLLVPSLSPAAIAAQTPRSLFGIPLDGQAGPYGLGAPLQILILLTALTLLPAIVVSVTPFLRITIVLHFLRQALGTQSTPSNQVLIGLALFLTLLIMQPVTTQIYTSAWQPLERNEITAADAWERAVAPLKTFLLRFAREKDIRLILEISRVPPPRTPADLDLRVLAPAYILSELRTGFQIGAVLFLPFLIIDLIAASVTLSVGMVQLPPVMISAPFKILLFVLVDGWNLVVGSLVKSFYGG
jgi:flagellar biosynthetic protein FliP